MKKVQYILSIIMLSLALYSCDNGGNADNKNNSGNGKSNNINTKKYKKCFEDFDYNFSQILSKEDVLKHIDAAHHADIKIDENKMKDRYGNIAYKYKSDRTFTIKAGRISQEIPDDNTIEFSGLNFSKSDEAKTLESFERSYKKLSAQEVDDMLANIDKAYTDKPKAELEQAKKFIEIRKKLQYHEVPDLGTAAYWQEFSVQGNNYGAELIVLAGTVEFTLKVKVDNDNKINAKMAIAIAQDILQKCK